jgi:hypothetical protein
LLPHLTRVLYIFGVFMKYAVNRSGLLLDTGKPHLTLVSVGCCSRARVCLDRRSETQIFVDPGAFIRTRAGNRRVVA